MRGIGFQRRVQGVLGELCKGFSEYPFEKFKMYSGFPRRGSPRGAEAMKVLAVLTKEAEHDQG